MQTPTHQPNKPDGGLVDIPGLKEFGRDMRDVSNQWTATVQKVAADLPGSLRDTSRDCGWNSVVLLFAGLVLVSIALGLVATVNVIGWFVRPKQ